MRPGPSRSWLIALEFPAFSWLEASADWEGEPASRALRPRRREPRTPVAIQVFEKQHAGQKCASAVGHRAPQVAVSSEPAYVGDAVPEPVDLAELVARTCRP